MAQAATKATATKTSLENKHLGNGDYFVIIAFSSHPLLFTEHAANGLITKNEIFTAVFNNWNTQEHRNTGTTRTTKLNLTVLFFFLLQTM